MILTVMADAIFPGFSALVMSHDKEIFTFGCDGFGALLVWRGEALRGQ